MHDGLLRTTLPEDLPQRGLTTLFLQARAPPPSSNEGAGRRLDSPPHAGVEGHKVCGTRKAEARSRQAPIRAPISGQYIHACLTYQKLNLSIFL